MCASLDAVFTQVQFQLQSMPFELAAIEVSMRSLS